MLCIDLEFGTRIIETEPQIVIPLLFSKGFSRQPREQKRGLLRRGNGC
jgi:hypothetical protein